MKKLSFLFSLICLLGLSSQSQTTYPTNGTTNPINTYYAFLNATIITDYENELKNATLLIQNEKIIAIGQKMDLPVGTVTVDLKGKFIYPSFIDIYSDYGLNSFRIERKTRGPQMEKQYQKGAYGWNQAVRSEVTAHTQFNHQPEKTNEFKKIGIGTVLSSFKDGIVRGSGVFVNFNNKKENESIIIDKGAAFYSFNKGSSTQDYPSSLTGAIALLRQTFYDAQWYKTNAKEK